MVATITNCPASARQGDKMLVAFSGFSANKTLKFEIINFGFFPDITTDLTGHVAVVVTIPNLANGTYNFRATDPTIGTTAAKSFQILNSAITDFPLMVFKHWQLPAAGRAQQTPTVIANTAYLEIMNIGRATGNATLIYQWGSISSSVKLSVTLAPGQFQGVSFPVVYHTGTDIYYATSQGGSLPTTIRTDRIEVPVVAAVGGYYPTVDASTQLLTPIGDLVQYTNPPGTDPCPEGYHYDLQSGHCINNITGGCLDCGPGDGGGGIIIGDTIFGIPTWLAALLAIGGAGVVAIAAMGKKRKLKLF